MPTLRDALHRALEATHTDHDLAEAILRQGAVSEALHLAAATDDDLQDQLGYTQATLRAQLSKARRRLPSSFPLPALEGRWWLNSDIAEYRTDHARSTRTAALPRSNGSARSANSASNTSIARTGIVDSSTGSAGT